MHEYAALFIFIFVLLDERGKLFASNDDSSSNCFPHVLQKGRADDDDVFADGFVRAPPP